MPSVVMLSVVMLSVVMLSVIMLSVVMLSVVMLSVVAPYGEIYSLEVRMIIELNANSRNETNLNEYLRLKKVSGRKNKIKVPLKLWLIH
jgi:hypothetical protein